MNPKVTIEVDPNDIESVLSTARKAIRQKDVGIEGDVFEAEAAIGAIENALHKAREKLAH
jgi:hypothetical protein